MRGSQESQTRSSMPLDSKAKRIWLKHAGHVQDCIQWCSPGRLRWNSRGCSWKEGVKWCCTQCSVVSGHLSLEFYVLVVQNCTMLIWAVEVPQTVCLYHCFSSWPCGVPCLQNFGIDVLDANDIYAQAFVGCCNNQLLSGQQKSTKEVRDKFLDTFRVSGVGLAIPFFPLLKHQRAEKINMSHIKKWKFITKKSSSANIGCLNYAHPAQGMLE